jgi:hypothetical protein
LQLASVFQQGPLIILQGIGACTNASTRTPKSRANSFYYARLSINGLSKKSLLLMTV